jgi:hypothetical protein
MLPVDGERTVTTPTADDLEAEAERLAAEEFEDAEDAEATEAEE